MVAKLLLHPLWRLVGNETKAHLCLRGRRDHRLRPLPDVSAAYPVHVACRPKPDPLQRPIPLLAGQRLDADLGGEAPLIESEPSDLLAPSLRRLPDVIVESAHCHSAVPVHQGGQDPRQTPCRIRNGSPVLARVKIGRRRPGGKLEVGQAAHGRKNVRDARREHHRVGDHDVVARQPLVMCREKAVADSGSRPLPRPRSA